ncbi:unnamed protein product [Somion occarium]|uniref:DUF6535 domain-containing protein n=1 Tax=Somion occarium TaxID=3059160 RepID=A0ABP1D7T2_9APHY
MSQLHTDATDGPPTALTADAAWWNTTAKAVREVDEAKIKDHKEDVDTLLVFGGLFSAIMTTLLVESYKTLQQDPADATLKVLEHISQQLNSFTINNTTSLVNNAIPPFMLLPSFNPSVSAICTNVAWFASLIISLVVASFGMLVKQWLREFLAGEYTSPQARLRIRCFRYPGLAQWRVFEIVAILPLLLQLALALFLIGLCFFTSSVHPSIAWTSVPLIAIWAGLFLAATLAPAFSPRCPYKTTFLKGPMQSLRRFLAKWPHIHPPPSGVRRLAQVTTRLIWFYILPLSPAWPDGNPGNGLEDGIFLIEEDDIVVDVPNDLDVLVEVDFIQTDDNLLRNALLDQRFLQVHRNGRDIVSFILRIVSHRTDTAVSYGSQEPRDLRRLSKELWYAVTYVLSSLLSQQLTLWMTYNTEQRAKFSDWMQPAVVLLLSMSSFPLPPMCSLGTLLPI